MLAIGGPGDRCDTGCMTDVRQQRLAGARVPNLYRGIKAGRCQLFAVRRPGDCCDPIGVPIIDNEAMSGYGVPDLYGLIETICFQDDYAA